MAIAYFLHSYVHGSDLLQQKQKEANRKHAWGETQWTSGASFQGFFSSRQSQRMHTVPQQQAVCVVLSISSLERDSVPKIGTGECSHSLSLPSVSLIPRRKADFQ